MPPAGDVVCLEETEIPLKVTAAVHSIAKPVGSLNLFLSVGLTSFDIDPILRHGVVTRDGHLRCVSSQGSLAIPSIQ